MSSRIIAWTCNNKFALFCGACLCFVVSTLAVGSLALAQNDTSKSIAASVDLFRDSMNSSQGYYRLPRYTVPKSYKLTLWPDMNNKTFSGLVVICIEQLEPTETIKLHSNKLIINSVSIRVNTRNIPIKSRITTSDRRELLIVDLFEEVPKGVYRIYISFEGRLDNGIVGFYASNLKSKKYV